MNALKQYNITPARGQALLSFQGRRFPDKGEMFIAMLDSNQMYVGGRSRRKFGMSEKWAEFNHLVL